MSIKSIGACAQEEEEEEEEEEGYVGPFALGTWRASARLRLIYTLLHNTLLHTLLHNVSAYTLLQNIHIHIFTQCDLTVHSDTNSRLI